MKKLCFILVLATLALFTQCKKQEPTENTEQNGIQMVLTANNGSRTSFGPDGAISWSANDKIYVVTNGQCVGYVTNGNEGGSTFTGTLSITSGNYDFHYYYVGNTQTIEAGATSFTMSFADQDGTLENLGDFHVGYGTQTGVEVTEGQTVTAQATMQTLVAMAYFDLAGMAEAGEKVFFYGDCINNQLTLDFSSNEPTFGKTNEEGQNLICAGTVANGTTSPCYVMLLPNHTDGTEEYVTNITFISKRTTGFCNDVFNYGIIGGRFYCKDGETNTPIPLGVTEYQKGTLRGVFSVSASQTVHFSQGNLQYTKSTQVWSFMGHQYDMVETDGQNVGDNYADQDVVSLFGWGTSGYNHGATAYQPWYTNNNYYNYWAYGKSNYNLYDGNGQADWGYNAIINGGITANSGWRTLTQPEWDYVFNTRNTSSGIRYAKAHVNGVSGVVLLPDNWANSLYALNNPNGGNYGSNTITAEDWTSILEANGGVFLPAAGYRSGTSVHEAGSIGNYWSSSYCGSDTGYDLFFDSDDIDGDDIFTGNSNRSRGCSVRLVRTAD